jgi:very-short-patch-repair endonuclease
MSNEKEVARNLQVSNGKGGDVLLSVAASGDAVSTAKPLPALTIEVALASKLSLADFQNAIPLLRELALVSTLDNDTGQVELSLSSTPAFVKPKTWHIDSIKAGDRYRIRDLDMQLDGTLLTRLTEAETATITLTVRPAGNGGERISESTKTVELLPRNQWGGLSHLPDMVAAFVQPNDPAVDRVLKKTAELLREHGKNPALDGYKEGGAKRAWELAGAVWGAVVSMKLDYALPPASFEHRGQKIRGATQVADSGLGTCMDLALLFCSTLEQIGLNPMVIFTRGHAFAGVWLKAEEFSTTVVDDVTALRKRLKLKELVLFETTLVTQRPPVPFSRAVDVGSEQLAEGKDDTFELAVDIRRARLQRIKPLSNPEVVLPAALTDIVADDKVLLEDAPDLPDDVVFEAEDVTLDPKDRLARWQRKLLDLSLRNNLLNFRATKKAIKLDAPDPGLLEDLMSGGKEIKLLPRPDLMDKGDPRSQQIHESRERENLRRQFALDALNRREVFIDITKEELEARMVELYRNARTTLQEGGSNTLFLALGFLTWNRVDKEDVKYRAPLILIPVALSRRSVRSGFSMTLHDDEPRFNPTLIEMLRQDFQLNLSIAEGELPRDDAGLDIEKVWKSISAAVKDIKGWEVSEEVVLSTFSFAKYLMWVDLVQRTDQLRQNPVVKHLIDTPRDPYPSSTVFPSPRSLDKDYGPEQTFCPLPADSSQLSAVMAAARGKDFVLIGPPGTGKSQTISNIVAQCLAEGKRVLFVSEKIAALDVVYRRLREVGLGEFCLELHSSKARKADVLAQLKNSWEARGEVDATVWQQEANRLKKIRDDLNVYVERLHHRHASGRSIYDAIGAVVDGADVPALPLSWASHAAHSQKETELLREVVDRLEVNAAAVGAQALAHGPLSEIGHADWSPSWQQGLIDAARRLLPVCNDVLAACDRFRAVIGLIEIPLTQRARVAMASLARCLPHAAGRDWHFAFSPDARMTVERLLEGKGLLEAHATLSKQLSSGWELAARVRVLKAVDLLKQRREVHVTLATPWSPFALETLREGISMLEELQHLEQALSVRYSDAVGQLNVYQLGRDYAKATKGIWPLSWLGKREVRQKLEAVVAGQGEPNVLGDLATLIAIRDKCADVEKLDAADELKDVWRGLKSRLDVLKAAALLQEVLKVARANGRWAVDGLEPLSAGRGGHTLANEVKKLERIAQLDGQMAELNTLESSTDRLWAGLDTNIPALEDAIAFTTVLPDLRAAGAMSASFEHVAQGACGMRLASDYRTLKEREGIETKLSGLDDLRISCPGTWKHLETNQDEVGRAVSFQRSIAAAVANLATGPEDVAEVCNALEQLVTEGNALLDAAGPVAAAGESYLEVLGRLQPHIDHLANLGSFTTEGQAGYSDIGISEIKGRSEAIIASEHKLNAWCAWRKVSQQAMAFGLSPIVAGLVNGAVAPADVRRAFETNYCRWWLNAVVDSEPVIRTFVSAEHERRITDFRVLDKHFTELTKAWLRANLCKGLPLPDDVTRSSEWGFLRHEITKKRAHRPLRELLSNIPTALTKLTPCLLMSPLSIAQYLAADAEPFDVVVFDEASQIPVWDAIGAIARGKQVVMVGDPKQLPPTNFFDRAESELDDEDVEGDMESILDECMGASLPTLSLDWHYRSRNESLIAFSNHHYYGGRLVTFPSPVTEDNAVSFHFVNGTYEKGGARVNKPEAKALVADIVARLKAPDFRASKLTIGVVTFNTEQQKLIEDLLDEERRQDPSLEPYFAESELEPLFVKNLESVQGDERDIMYFSITYGPDGGGHVSMNFGPMNRAGGERRLNVAITRARQELRVFSTLRGDQFDLSKTQSIGVRDLKHFLEFAVRGSKALFEVSTGSLGGFESPFEEAVAGALTAKGWMLHTQVGASAFRVDLAVVHPDAPGSYLSGVECDGATYHRSATARDRDMLREQILRGLGWDILRIWSTDWWVDPQGTVERVCKQLDELLTVSRAKRAVTTEKAAAETAAREAIERAIAEKASDPVPSSANKRTHISEVQIDQVADEHEDVLEEAYARRVSVPDVSECQFEKHYVECDPSNVVESLDPDAFFDKAYDERFQAMVAHVVAIEGPVLDLVLARRISRAHGWQRTGSRIQERVEEIARRIFKTTEESVGTFFWPMTMVPGGAVAFRAPSPEAQRSMDEVCMEELMALANHVVDATATDDENLVAMARALGILRLRASSRGRLEEALARFLGASPPAATS